MTYQDAIRQTLDRAGFQSIDARHVEAYLRLEYHTLDAMSSEQMDALTIELVQDIVSAPDIAEELALSYAL